MSKMRGGVARLLPGLLVGAVVAAWGVGCGVDLPTPPVGNGRVCYEDSDCVPNGCCGEATDAIHRQDAPDCSQVVCTGSCPADEVDCGCGIPVCSGSHCTVAVTAGEGCPAVRD